MNGLKDRLFALLTSGKYSGIQDEKDMDAVIRLIVLNITYTITSIVIAGIGITDMRKGLIDQGLLELIIGFMIFLNLTLLRTELPFTVGGFIIITIYGCFCGMAVYARNELQGSGNLWIYSYPLMSIFTLGLPLGLIPALILFAVVIVGTFVPGLAAYDYTPQQAILTSGVYLFVLVLTVIYEFVRSVKDRWLSRQDGYMNMVFRNSPDIILLLDKTGRLVYCADVFLGRIKTNSARALRKEHYTKLFSRFSSREQLDELTKFLVSMETEKKPVVIERTMDIGRDGNSRHYEIHFTPMYNDSGEFQGTFILFHDMTEIIEAKIRTEQASTAKTNFLASMSHEIRTPLNAIIGMTTIAVSTGETARKDYCLAQISNASTHLLGIINDILDVSKIEEGKFEIVNAEFDFAVMLKRAVDIFEFRFAEKDQDFSLKTDPNIPSRVITDEQRLTQVLTNLLSNAVKFTPHMGKIRLEVKRLDSGGNGCCELELRVSDTGIGISREQQGKLFQAFVQVDSSTSRRFGGIGLGLTISKKIAEMMNGDIRIESEPGKGATFIVTLTAGIPERPINAAEDGPDGENADAAPDYGGKHILLAEDVEINREIVTTILEEFNITSTAAEDGRQAYDIFAANPEKFDLIFMDIHMPEVNGYEATRLIRALEHPAAKSVPIIAMTANVFREDVERCLEAGMNAHVGKPLDFDDVTEILKIYLGKRRVKEETTAGGA